MNQMSTVERPRRREYSAEFKTSVLGQSRRPGASLAGVALAHGINPNMVHRWIREERQRLELAELQRGAAAFLPVQLPQVPVAQSSPVPRVVPTLDPSDGGQGIRVEIQRAVLLRPRGSKQPVRALLWRQPGLRPASAVQR